jgi:hypothetical protein
MRRLSVAVLLAAALGLPAAAQHFQLDRGVAGPVALGDTVDRIYARVGRDNTRLVDLFQEGLFSPALEVRLPDAPVSVSLTVVIREWPCSEFSAWGIRVHDPRYKTVDGLGVGSTVADVRRRYRGVMIEPGEGERVMVVKDAGLTFMLDVTPAAESTWRVKSVWVVPQPELVRRLRCAHRGPLGGG